MPLNALNQSAATHQPHPITWAMNTITEGNNEQVMNTIIHNEKNE